MPAQPTVRPYAPSDHLFMVQALEELLDYIGAQDSWERVRRSPEFGQRHTASLLRRVEEGLWADLDRGRVASVR